MKKMPNPIKLAEEYNKFMKSQKILDFGIWEKCIEDSINKIWIPDKQ